MFHAPVELLAGAGSGFAAESSLAPSIVEKIEFVPCTSATITIQPTIPVIIFH